MAEANDISDREVANAINICTLSLLILLFLLVVFNFLNSRSEEISNKYLLELKVQPKHRMMGNKHVDEGGIELVEERNKRNKKAG